MISAWQVHDNLTLGLLRQRLKREIAARGGGRVSYRAMALYLRGKGGGEAMLAGESATLRELGVGEDLALLLRLAPRGKEGREAGIKETRDAKLERRAALPGNMVAASSSYLEVLHNLPTISARSHLDLPIISPRAPHDLPTISP